MNIELLNTAAKIIESEGEDGIKEAAKLVGMPTALALMISLLRHGFRSMSSEPTDNAIDASVMESLANIPAASRFLGRDIACFYTGEWYCLDNFSAFVVPWGDRVWPTAEHAYQAAKFLDQDIIDKIGNATSPYFAKSIGNDPQFDSQKRENWRAMKRGIMKEILLEKALFHMHVYETLRRSRGKVLVEDSPIDGFWGRGADWEGENWVGRLWMEVRVQLFGPETV